MSIKIGSRKSHLAKIQARNVQDEIKRRHPELNTELFLKPSFGDLNLDLNLSQANTKGVFTQDFLEHLKDKSCDLVVHSWKDLPIEENSFTQVTGTLKREDTRDLFLLKKSALKKNQYVFLTSSPRREFHIKSFFEIFEIDKKVSFKEIRGNIPTRFNKFLNDSEADGFCIAVAAVKRLVQSKEFNDEYPGLWKKIVNSTLWCVLPESVFPSAPAQGALAIETLKANEKINKIVETINDDITKICVEKERKILKRYGGGCHLAIGSTVYNNNYGTLYFEAGHHKGEVFRKVRFSPKRAYPKVNPEEVWISSENITAKRNLVEVKPPPKEEKKSFIVTRSEAFQENLYTENQDYIFVSGTITWKKLLQKGIWVNGSLDFLGQEMYVEDLFKEGVKTYWLTREGLTGPYETLETYSLTMEFDPATLQNKNAFVWTCGELMVSSILKYRELKNKSHFLGMGRSMEFALKKTQELGLDVKIYPFYTLKQLKEDLGL